MNLFLELLLLLILSACQPESKDGHIAVDLKDAEKRIEYSSFVDSVSYLTLCLEEPIGRIERMYKNGDFYYVWGEPRCGILIFDKFGKLYSRINSYGEGPEEFRMISSFSVVSSIGDVCILDYASQETKYYGMDGSFKFSRPCPNWSVDLATFNLEHTIYISPFYISDKYPSGIWLADKDNKIVRYLSEDVTPEHKFYYYPMTYNLNDTCLYYYDRNWDYFSRVSEQGMQTLLRFDVRRKLPASMMGDTKAPLARRNGYVVCDKFVYSLGRLLMLYCELNYNEDEHSYVWVMVNKCGQQVKVAHELFNDMDDVEVTGHELYHLDNKTWVRVCDEVNEDFNIRLQLLHLKER